jgi:hypothetical protein
LGRYGVMPPTLKGNVMWPRDPRYYVMPAPIPAPRGISGLAITMWALTIISVILAFGCVILFFVVQPSGTDQFLCSFGSQNACNSLQLVNIVHVLSIVGGIGGAVCIVLFGALAIWATVRWVCPPHRYANSLRPVILGRACSVALSVTTESVALAMRQDCWSMGRCSVSP